MDSRVRGITVSKIVNHDYHVVSAWKTLAVLFATRFRHEGQKRGTGDVQEIC